MYRLYDRYVMAVLAARCDEVLFLSPRVQLFRSSTRGEAFSSSMARRFSSTDVDPEDDDPNAAVMESWQASIRRQAQLLMALAVSRKRYELLARRKDNSVVQQVMAHEFSQLERASALQFTQHANALDGLRLWGRALEARLGVTVDVLSADLAEMEETHRVVEHTLAKALRERSRELQEEQALLVDSQKEQNRLVEQAKAMVRAAPPCPWPHYYYLTYNLLLPTDATHSLLPTPYYLLL